MLQARKVRLNAIEPLLCTFLVGSVYREYLNLEDKPLCINQQVTVPETEHTVLFELGNGQWDIPQLRSLLEALLTSARPVQNFEVEHSFEQIGQKAMLLNACKLQQDDNDAMILLAISAITERQQFEAERSQLSARAVSSSVSRNRQPTQR